MRNNEGINDNKRLYIRQKNDTNKNNKIKEFESPREQWRRVRGRYAPKAYRVNPTVGSGENLLKNNGGEWEIRTLDTFRYTRFPSVRTRPLCELSRYHRYSTAEKYREKYFLGKKIYIFSNLLLPSGNTSQKFSNVLTNIGSRENSSPRSVTG